jgi:hypothetical protein
MAQNVTPGKALDYTISGTGSFPREDQGAQGGGGAPGDNGGAGAGGPGSGPGGGIGVPIDTPDPLSKYKWWILGGLALLLVAAAGFLLRKPAGATAGVTAGANASVPNSHTSTSPAAKNAALLNALKEELFALESEKIAGTLAPEEYAEQKAALETVLKRALKRNA